MERHQKLPPPPYTRVIFVATDRNRQEEGNHRECKQQPHEIQTTEKGVGPTGSEIERKVSIAGKSLK